MGSDILSSDILERQFGPVELAILHQDGVSRIITTSVKGGGQVLELSYVKFIPVGSAEFPDAHQAVIDGESMGKAFREAGIPFKRHEQFACRLALPESLQHKFGSNKLANVVGVSILVGPGETPYAEILEIYHPAVQWPRYAGKPIPEQLASITLLDEFLLAN